MFNLIKENKSQYGELLYSKDKCQFLLSFISGLVGNAIYKIFMSNTPVSIDYLIVSVIWAFLIALFVVWLGKKVIK